MTNTTTLRERFEKEFSNRWWIPESKKQFLDFIESELQEAERRGEERMKDKALRLVDEHGDYLEFILELRNLQPINSLQ